MNEYKQKILEEFEKEQHEHCPSQSCDMYNWLSINLDSYAREIMGASLLEERKVESSGWEQTYAEQRVIGCNECRAEMKRNVEKLLGK